MLRLNLATTESSNIINQNVFIWDLQKWACPPIQYNTFEQTNLTVLNDKAGKFLVFIPKIGIRITKRIEDCTTTHTWIFEPPERKHDENITRKSRIWGRFFTETSSSVNSSSLLVSQLFLPAGSPAIISKIKLKTFIAKIMEKLFLCLTRIKAECGFDNKSFFFSDRSNAYCECYFEQLMTKVEAPSRTNISLKCL